MDTEDLGAQQALTLPLALISPSIVNRVALTLIAWR